MLSENPNMPEAMEKIDDYSHTLYEEMKLELEKLMMNLQAQNIMRY
jgi:hypothetical protein